MNPEKPKSEAESVLSADLIMLQRYIETLWRFLPLPICDVNGAFVIINVDRKFADFFGYKPEQIIGVNLEKVFKFSEDFEEIKKELVEKKAIFNKETIVLTKEKQEVSVSIFAQSREDETGFVISYFLAFIDMSEIKKRGGELQEKIEELEKFREIAVDRELKMMKLKEEIEKLKKGER